MFSAAGIGVLVFEYRGLRERLLYEATMILRSPAHGCNTAPWERDLTRMFRLAMVIDLA